RSLRRRHLGRELTAVLPAAPDLALRPRVRRADGCDKSLQQLGVAVPQALGQKDMQGLPQHFLGPVLEDALRALVEKGDAVLLVDRYDGVLRDRQDAGEPLLSHARRKPVGPAAHSGLAYGQLRPQLANLVDQLFMAAFRHVYPAPACLAY